MHLTAGEHIRYILAAPSGAGTVVPDPTSSSSEYTTPITISSSTVVRATIFTNSDVAHGLPVATAQFAVEVPKRYGHGGYRHRAFVVLAFHVGEGAARIFSLNVSPARSRLRPVVQGQVFAQRLGEDRVLRTHHHVDRTQVPARHGELAG